MGASGDLKCLLLLGSKKQHAPAFDQQVDCSRLVTFRGTSLLVCAVGLPSVVQKVVVDQSWFNIRHRKYATVQA